MTGEDLRRVGRRVAQSMGLRGPEAEDVMQDVAVVMLETWERYRLPLRGNLGFYFTAARRVVVGEQLTRKALLSYGSRNGSGARRALSTWEAEGPRVRCGFGVDEVVGEIRGRMFQVSAPERADAAVRARDAGRARERWRDVVVQHVELGRGDRDELLAALGIGRPQRDPEEIHAAGGRKPRAVWAAIHNLGRGMARDPGARRAARLVLEQEA